VPPILTPNFPDFNIGATNLSGRHLTSFLPSVQSPLYLSSIFETYLVTVKEGAFTYPASANLSCAIHLPRPLFSPSSTQCPRHLNSSALRDQPSAASSSPHNCRAAGQVSRASLARGDGKARRRRRPSIPGSRGCGIVPSD
jgi:hypothetical protein